jgi:hypothetical protein
VQDHKYFGALCCNCDLGRFSMIGYAHCGSQAGFTSWEQMVFVFAIVVPALASSLFVQM